MFKSSSMIFENLQISKVKYSSRRKHGVSIIWQCNMSHAIDPAQTRSFGPARPFIYPYIIYRYICNYLCMYVCVYVCLYVCLYVCPITKNVLEIQQNKFWSYKMVRRCVFHGANCSPNFGRKYFQLFFLIAERCFWECKIGPK